MKKDHLIKLSVAIVNYKTKDLVRNLLLSLKKEDGLEIVVLDNGSGDDVGEMIKDKFPEVKFIQSGTNLGFSKGYNLALNACQGQYLLLLNSDIEVRRGAIKKLLVVEEELGGEVVLTGKLFLPDGSVQKSTYHLPTILRAIREYLLGETDAYFSFLPNQDKPSLVEGAVMACLLIPRVVWDKIGHLDEGTSFYFEDVDYSRRLKQAKIPLYYVPGAVFYHHHGASSKKLPEGEAAGKLAKAAKHYHGFLKYYIITAILWLGQKVRKLSIS